MMVLRTTYFISLVLSLVRCKTGGQAACEHIKKNWSDGEMIKTDVPTGVWMSERCETRPGPEFLLRKYTFHDNNQFEVLQYYYADVGCSVPQYALMATGALTGSQKSWTIPGAQMADYELKRVTVIPYGRDIAKKLARKINKSCLNILQFPWGPMEKYDILHMVSEVNSRGEEEDVILDRDCTAALKWSLHELQLFMVQRHSNYHHPRNELFLGDIHTDVNSRQTYRPTGFQDPLLDEHSPWCVACKRLIESDIYHPPHLHERNPPNTGLTGDWLSLRCEIRPNAVFLTRHIRINTDGTWRGVFMHYNDPGCQKASFSIYAEGNYESQGNSRVVRGAGNYKFTSETLMVRPEDIQMVRFLNSKRSGGCSRGIRWQKGIERKLGETGCKALSLKAPYIEYDIVSIEKLHKKSLLHFGQRSSSGHLLTSAQDRPTSFQSPLIKCERYNIKLLTVNKNVLESYNSQVSGDLVVAEKSTGHQLSSHGRQSRACYLIMYVLVGISTVFYL